MADDLLVQTGGLPAAPYTYAGSSSYQKDIFDGWTRSLSQDALVPFIDQSAPGMYDAATAACQELALLKITPEQFAQTLQKQYAKGLAS